MCRKDGPARSAIRRVPVERTKFERYGRGQAGAPRQPRGQERNASGAKENEWLKKGRDCCAVSRWEGGLLVQYPLPDYGSPTSVNFSPGDNLISFMFSPDQTLNMKVFVYDLTTQIVLFIVDSGCSKHMTGNLKLLSYFVEFRNDQIALILGYGDLLLGEWYSTQSRAYRVYNKRKRVIVETIHVNFNELPLMASDHVRSDPVLQCPTMALEQVSLSPGPQSQENVPQTVKSVTTSNELDFLFSLMFDELLNGTTPVVSKSSAVTAADSHNQRQQHNKTSSTSTTVAEDIPPLNIQTTPETTNQAPTQAQTITSTEDINQAETQKENA
ncbi:hypothetical protein Tco_0486824 [Tanacetum coccineum]